MSVLRRLPNEILMLIPSHLDEKEDKQTILTLRAVSKHYNRLATPLVWCTVVDSIGHRHTNPPEVGPLQRVAWDIVQHPELARWVKAIDFEGWDNQGRDRVTPLPQGIQPPSLAAYSAALAPADLTSNVHQAILRQVCEETPIGHLSLLLALCTKLKVLVLPSQCGAFSRLITRILLRDSRDRLTITLPPDPSSVAKNSLQFLQEINNGDPFHCDSAVRRVLPLLCLPSLRDLHIYSLCDARLGTNYGLLDTPRSYLNHNSISFVFDSCMLSDRGLGRILGACENPFSLTIRWRSGFRNYQLSSELIGQALREFGHRLEYLHLDTTDVYTNRTESHLRSPPPFGSFASMTNLKTLAVPRYAFPTENCSVADIVSILPPTLQKLYILGVGNEKSEEERAASDAFVDTCCHARHHMPSLREISTVQWYHFTTDERGGPVQHATIDYKAKAAEGLWPLKRNNRTYSCGSVAPAIGY